MQYGDKVALGGTPYWVYHMAQTRSLVGGSEDSQAWMTGGRPPSSVWVKLDQVGLGREERVGRFLWQETWEGRRGKVGGTLLDCPGRSQGIDRRTILYTRDPVYLILL